MRAIYQGDKSKVPQIHSFVPLTRQELLDLKVGSLTLCMGHNGKIYRVKVNGKPKTWKTNAAIKIPIKYGLREYAYGGKGLTSILTLYREVNEG